MFSVALLLAPHSLHRTNTFSFCAPPMDKRYRSGTPPCCPARSATCKMRTHVCDRWCSRNPTRLMSTRSPLQLPPCSILFAMGPHGFHSALSPLPLLRQSSAECPSPHRPHSLSTHHLRRRATGVSPSHLQRAPTPLLLMRHHLG